jgi:hypothetical protein
MDEPHALALGIRGFMFALTTFYNLEFLGWDDSWLCRLTGFIASVVCLLLLEITYSHSFLYYLEPALQDTITIGIRFLMITNARQLLLSWIFITSLYIFRLNWSFQLLLQWLLLIISGIQGIRFWPPRRLNTFLLNYKARLLMLLT